MLDHTLNLEQDKLGLEKFLRLPGFVENYEMFKCLLHDYGGDMDTDEFIGSADVDVNLFELGYNLAWYGSLFIERHKAFEALRDNGIEWIKSRSDINERLVVAVGSKLIVGEWCRYNHSIYITLAGTTDMMPGRPWGGTRKRNKADRKTAENMLINLYAYLTE